MKKQFARQEQPVDSETQRSLSTSGRRTLLVFQVAGQRYGVSSSDVEQVTAMAEMHRPPGTPKVLYGFLNIANDAIPVVCLRRLFGQPDVSPGVWTPLIVLRGSDRRLVLLVDDVQRIVRVDAGSVLPLPAGHVLNNCVEGVVRMGNESLLLLSPERLLLEEEAQSVAELQQLAQQRLRELQEAEA